MRPHYPRYSPRSSRPVRERGKDLAGHPDRQIQDVIVPGGAGGPVPYAPQADLQGTTLPLHVAPVLRFAWLTAFTVQRVISADGSAEFRLFPAPDSTLAPTAAIPPWED